MNWGAAQTQAAATNRPPPRAAYGGRAPVSVNCQDRSLGDEPGPPAAGNNSGAEPPAPPRRGHRSARGRGGGSARPARPGLAEEFQFPPVLLDSLADAAVAP